MIKKIIYISCTRLDYSLNAVLIKGLRENGIEVIGIHTKNRRMIGIFRTLSFYRQNKNDADFVVVGYDSAILVFPLRFFCRKKIIFNAVLSSYERVVVSRGLVSRFSLKATYYLLLDFLAMHSANLVIAESGRQTAYLQKLFKIPGRKLHKGYIGVDEEKFFYDPTITKFEIFTVLFRGALLPESGAEYVIRAAKLLEDKEIKFIMIGGGLCIDKIKKIIEKIKPSNLEHKIDFIPYEKLRGIMQKSHLSLGQVSDHERLSRTIPHKAYETLAMKLPYLTASNQGILELLKEGETCLTCKPANAESLAEKILWAKDHPQELGRIAQNGYDLYKKELTSYVLAKNLLNKVKLFF